MNEAQIGAREGVLRVNNPPNPYHKSLNEWIDCAPPAELQIFEERAKTVLTENKSPDIGFRFGVNPYRGCFHGCAYCYARPSHQYLDFGAGTDFERKIIVKINAPEKLDEELSKKRLSNEWICFSGNTDCYQPLEASYELTRRCLEVCLKHRRPVSIITKGAIIRRDIDLLVKLHETSGVEVHMSIAFDDDQDSKLIEPGAPRPSVRFRALKEISEAGIPTRIAVAPIICGLNDAQIPAILERAKDAGAQSAFMTVLRLPRQVKDVFSERVVTAMPQRAAKILSQIRAARGGVLNRSEFGERMRGEGPRWEMVEWLFSSNCKRLGLTSNGGFRTIASGTKRLNEVRRNPQLSLFRLK